MTTPLQVLICDDSVMYRNLMNNVVQGIPNAQVAASVKNGKEAIAFLENNAVDVAFLDVVMPEMDGIETLEVIRRRFPKIKVVMVSSANKTQADITIKALSNGALDFISKPEGSDIRETIQTLQETLSKVVAGFSPGLTSTGRSTYTSAVAHTPAPPRAQEPRLGEAVVNVHAIGIASSTGGPDALGKLIPLLKGDLNVPVFITQHMPPVFTASLASHLDKKSVLTVKEAEDGEIIQKNIVYIAPGGKHLTLVKVSGQVQVKIDDGPPENSCKPSADVMFRSLPTVYGNHVLNVVLTGIGSDGAKGVEFQRQTGGYCLSQDAATCVVYGMPKAVFDMGLSNEVLPLEAIADRVNTLVKTGVRSVSLR